MNVIYLLQLNSDYNEEYDDSSNRNRNNERHHNNRDREREHDITKHTFNSRSAYRFLRLIWDERGKQLEYTLRFNNTRRGFWLSSGPQKGKLYNRVINRS